MRFQQVDNLYLLMCTNVLCNVLQADFWKLKLLTWYSIHLPLVFLYLPFRSKKEFVASACSPGQDLSLTSVPQDYMQGMRQYLSVIPYERDSAFCLVTSDPRSKSHPLYPWCPFLLIAFRHGRTHSDFTHKYFLGLRHREGDSPW